MGIFYLYNPSRRRQIIISKSSPFPCDWDGPCGGECCEPVDRDLLGDLGLSETEYSSEGGEDEDNGDDAVDRQAKYSVREAQQERHDKVREKAGDQFRLENYLESLEDWLRS